MCYYAGCVSLRLLLKLRWPTLSAVPERILCKPRQTVGRPATDQNRLCYTLWHERTEEEKTLWSGSTGALRDKQRNVYSGLFSNSDPTRFLFLKVFFFFARIFWLEYLLSRVKLCLIFPFLWNWQGKCVKLSEKQHLHEKCFLVLSV